MAQIKKLIIIFSLIILPNLGICQDSTKIKIVFVKWEDIINTDSGWHTIEESVEFVSKENSIVNQVGFLLRKDDKYLVMVESYFDEENGKVGTVIRIPICNIKEYYEIDFWKPKSQ